MEKLFMKSLAAIIDNKDIVTKEYVDNSIPTKTSDLTNDSGFLTSHQTLYEANLNWGGKDFSSGYSPIDAAMIDVLGANRFAFLRAAGLTIEYSTDGGSSYTDYGATDAQKVGLFSSGQSFYLGKHTSNGSCTTNDRLRVTIDTGAANIYTVLNKIAIYMSTYGATVQVLIEKALQSTPTTFSTHKDWTGISGWSGWNILNISGLTTYGNTPTSQYGRIRFTFRQTAVNTTYTSANISKIMGFGGVGWTVPSTMAATGHLYSYDSSQNATFPANVTATQFNGNVQATTINGVTVGSSPKFTDTDEKVSQSYKTASEYTYWRPLLIGYSSGSAATFTPSSITNLAYTFNTLKVQPSTGTIRINNLALYKGSYTSTFTPTTLTADRTITIPNNTGTMALTSDIPSVPAWALESSKPSYTFSEIGSKPTTISGYGITDAYTKTEVDNKVSAVLRYKGVKATVANLPTTGNTTGDVWHVTATSGEYAWDGTEWQELGTAISIPASTGSATTGISIAAHGTGTVIGVQSSTTTVRGVKTGTNSTTTASKVTFGTAFSVPNPSFTDVTVPIRADADVTVPVAASSATTVPIKATSATTVPIKNADATSIPNVTSVGSASTWTFEEKTIPNVTSAGSASTWTFEEKTIPNVTSAGAASSWTFEEKTIPNVTAAGSGSASLTFTMDTTDTKKLVISFSHTHTAPTLGTAIKVQSKSGGSNGTAPTLGTAIKVQSKSGGANGTAPTLGTAIKVQSKSGGANGTAPTLGTDISIIGVQSSTTSVIGVQSSTTSVTGVSGSTTVRGVKTGTSSTTTASKATLGTAISVPNPSATNVTVPIIADADTTVPIKNTSASTFVTGTTHTVTDNGHTHTI